MSRTHQALSEQVSNIAFRTSKQEGQESQPSEKPGQEIERSSSLNSIGRQTQAKGEGTNLTTKPSQPSAQTTTREQHREKVDGLKTQKEQVLQANIRAKERAFTIPQTPASRPRSVPLPPASTSKLDQVCTHEAQTRARRDASAKAWKELHRDYIKESAAVLGEIARDRETGAFMALRRGFRA